MWKTLRILFLFLPLIACQNQSEVTVATTHPTTTTTMLVDHPPPTRPPTTTTTTTIPPTTTTLTESTYQAASLIPTGNIWDEMSECEDNDDPAKGPTGWASNTGNGFEGGLQFTSYTWRSYVGFGKPYELVGYPVHAYDATREQQITVAIRVRDGVEGSSDPYLNAQGYGAWPTCRHVVGV